MEMKQRSIRLDRILPILTIKDDIIVSKRGELTVGWEVSLPTICSLTRGDYDEMLEALSSAIRGLGPGFIIHRQDIYTSCNYNPEDRSGFLEKAYETHFKGREFLEHRQYLFMTHTRRDAHSRPVSSSGIFSPPTPNCSFLTKDLMTLEAKASEFAAILTGREGYRLERMDSEKITSVMSSHLNLQQKDGIYYDIEQLRDKIKCGNRQMWGYSICESRQLPSILHTSQRSESLSGASSSIFLSSASSIGPLLDCEHMVNTYIFTLPQEDILRDAVGRKRRMTSMSQNAENVAGAEELEEFIQMAHKENLTCVKAHVNVLVWGNENQEQELRGKVSSALSGMNIQCVQNTCDLPVLWYSAIPGAAGEISSDNLMLRELKSFLCLGINETYDKGHPTGNMKLCDRIRHIPLRIDIQEEAYREGLIDNYNAFILGGSGTGKSFFTNFFVRSCYDAGQTVFIIDVGDSYQGLCSVINQESQGRDGIYYTWDRYNPISFDAFIGIDEWIDDNDTLQQENDGLNFLLSFLQTLWSPEGGWNADSGNILKQIIFDFVKSRKTCREKPIFNDLRTFIVSEIAPLFFSKRGYKCGDIIVHRDRFDINALALAMGDYAKGGSFGFLLNDPNPRDLFSSRFTVFEVDKLAGIKDKKFYSLCILCIMNSFNAKMRNAPGMKVMVIEEAWKAIANETMSGYLTGLWKTARKFQTSAVVVTQQVSDIMSSNVIRDTILQNSSVKILLDQSNNRNSFSQLQQLLGLTDHQKDVILSMNRAHKAGLKYRDVFIALGDKKYGVYATEVSPEEAIAYESNKEKKKPFLEQSSKVGAIEAIKQLAGGG